MGQSGLVATTETYKNKDLYYKIVYEVDRKTNQKIFKSRNT